MKATVGRIVHYYDQDNDGPFAAIITKIVDGERVNLDVFWPVALTHRDGKLEGVPFCESDEQNGLEVSGYWVWPVLK